MAMSHCQHDGSRRGKVDANVVGLARITVRRCGINDLASHGCGSIGKFLPADVRECAHSVRAWTPLLRGRPDFSG
jgi:hypothetical protein